MDDCSTRPIIVGYEDWPPGMDDMLNWCENISKGKWSYGLHHQGSDAKLVCVFYFDNAEDWCLFSLTWGIT